jgi:O-antigen ligase
MQNAILRRMRTILLILGPATTLAISPFSSFDPINLVKMIVVTAGAFSLLGLVVAMAKNSWSRLSTGIWLSSSFFVFWMVVVMFLSGAPLAQQFWGVFGRNNGFVGYFSLVIILVAVAIVQEVDFYRRLVVSLVLTSVPVTIYALIQLVGNDPIAWSVMAPFATLGNVNFSSAFFGLAAIASTVLAASQKQNLALRLLLLTLVLVDLFIVLETGSIQGFMIYVAGMGVVGFFIIRNIRSLKVLQMPYVLLGICGFTVTALALKNIGPLAKYVFGETILYRFDYWFAGWAMTVRNPLFGVGLDSYGDWYRELRGEIATLRTVPDRITNTAHNIYLDISASGGFPLIAAYLVILGYALLAAIRVIRREQTFNPYFVALFSCWIAYLIQAAISINQIGVGIWGWLFTGALIGYEISTRATSEPRVVNNKSVSSSQLPVIAALLGIIGFGFGFMVSFIPFNADAKFKIALSSGNLEEQFLKAKSTGATAFHMELVLDGAIKANNANLAAEIVDELLSRYPRDFMGWRVKQILVNTTPKEREIAFQQLRALDPFNPEITQNK